MCGSLCRNPRRYRPDRQGQCTGRQPVSLLQRKRLELARALATEPKLLLLDEIAGGLTEGECRALVATIRASMHSGIAVIWIEHVLHALNSVVERLLVLHFGKVIGIGKPDEIMASQRSARNLSGDRSLMALLETKGLTASYGDFQALFGVDISARTPAKRSPSSAPTGPARRR